jgi:deoxyribonuclease-1-like protein
MSVKKLIWIIVSILLGIATIVAVVFFLPEKEEIQPRTIKIASFNIQVFGQSKLKNDVIMDYIVQIIKNFDIVAIQEIRSKEQDVIPTLVAKLYDDVWDFRISERLGRTSSKEQYAFVFKKGIIDVDSCFQIPDPQDVLHREPYVCYAQAGNFDFSLINIHTDPDEVDEEINFLDDILRSELDKEKDAILLGDLNASPSQFDELTQMENIGWVVNDGIPTNTRETKTYDNLVFIKSNVIEYISGGVFNFKSEYQISDSIALKISDHFPVYGEFDINMPDDD